MILQIFQKHAQTREAKLQVRLAEIPYLKARLFSDLDLENESKHSKQRRGREWFDKQRLALNKREKSIKSDLDKGGVISEGIFICVPFSENELKHCSIKALESNLSSALCSINFLIKNFSMYRVTHSKV